MGFPSATRASSASSARQSSPPEVTGRTSACDDGRVERGPPGRDRADGIDELVTFGDVVLQEVAVARRTLGEQRHGVLGVVVLRQDHDAGTRVTLAHLLGRVDAFAVERRRHADVGHEHVGLVAVAPATVPLEVRGDADDTRGPGVARSVHVRLRAR